MSEAALNLETTAAPRGRAAEEASRLTPAQWGILAFLGSEAAFFSTLIVSYVIFYGRDSQPGGLGGPTPREALSLSLVGVTTACLLASSLTIHLAERLLRSGHEGWFRLLWAATIALGVLFLSGTAYEWVDLIRGQKLTISRNLFGTTFYTLVGFHGLHVSGGLAVMLILLALTLQRRLTAGEHAAVGLVAWYWHFVDVVWILVFAVVYLVPHAS